MRKLAERIVVIFYETAVFWNYVPIDIIDIHEERFLLRTGIFHTYASINKSDPRDYDYLAIVMKAFCKKELKNLKIKKIPL